MRHLQTIKLKATKPTTIWGSTLFSWISSDFRVLDVKGKATEATSLNVFEMDKDGTFKDIFADPDKMVLTQGQILEFCKNHKEQLRTGGFATFFLFKNGPDFFVANVDLDDGGTLLVFVDHFSDDGHVWSAESRLRVVVPATETVSPSPESLRPSETLTLDSAIKLVKDNGYKIFKEI